MSKSKDYNNIDWNKIFVEDSSSPTLLRWRIDCNNKTKAGAIAGSISNDKKSGRQCFHVGFNKTLWIIHRILWVMRNGAIDVDLTIDHIDGNALNNSVDNLRLVSAVVNSRNQKQPSTNSSGVIGVGFTTIKGYTYVIAQWYNLSGKKESKTFSCNRLGLLEAFAAACAYRDKMIVELNNTGAEYSKRHGNREGALNETTSTASYYRKCVRI